MTGWKAIWLTFFYIIIGTLIQVGLLSILHLLDIEGERYWILHEVSMTIGIVTSFYIFYKILIKKEAIPKKDFIDFKSSRLFLLPFIAIGLFLFDKIFFDGYHYIFTDNFKIEKFNIKSIQFNYVDLIYLISPLILAPLLEEIVFRKYIFMKLLEKNSLIPSVLISSLCFSLIHFPNFRNLIPTFIFGIIAAYLFYKTKNILYPIMLHFFGNLLWAILKYYDNGLQENLQGIKFSLLYWFITLSGFAIVVILTKLFLRNIKKAET